MNDVDVHFCKVASECDNIIVNVYHGCVEYDLNRNLTARSENSNLYVHIYSANLFSGDEYTRAFCALR